MKSDDLSEYSDCFVGLPIAESFRKMLPNYSGTLPNDFVSLVNTGVFTEDMIDYMKQVCEVYKKTGGVNGFGGL